MARTAFLTGVAAASALAILAGSPAARAGQCDDIVAAFNKRMDEIRATRKDGDRLPTLCARMGRISGQSAAVSIVAQECFEAGSKRDKTMRSAADTESMLEIDALCK